MLCSYILFSKLFRSNAPVLFEYADKVAGVSKSGLLADECEVIISKQEILFGLENAHLLDVLLTCHAVELVEFGRKARITHITFLGNLGYADIFLKVLIDIFGYIFYSILTDGIDWTIVDIQPLCYPIPDNCEKQPVYMRSENRFPAVLVVIEFIYTLPENLFAAETLRFLTAKMHFHVLGSGITQDIGNRRCIGQSILKSCSIKLDSGKSL